MIYEAERRNNADSEKTCFETKRRGVLNKQKRIGTLKKSMNAVTKKTKTKKNIDLAPETPALKAISA